MQSSDRGHKASSTLSRFAPGRASDTLGAPSDSLSDAVAAEDEADEARAARVGVDDDGVRRPFMLGILVHSLTESGLSFEDAYGVSRKIWAQIRDRTLVTKDELRELIADFAGSPSGFFESSTPALGGPLEVSGSNGRWPFNQTRIHQSFLAAGLDPARAFELVSEIEWQLRGRGDSLVTRDSIRTLANELLTDQFGKSMANRYRTYRHYQNEDRRPIIVLLGGTSGVGKSSLALEVARRLSIGRVLSTDSIRDVMRVMVSDDLVPTLHVSSFEAHTRLAREPEGDLDLVIEGFLDQTRTVSVGVRAVIERAVLEGTSLVLDGVSLVPGFLDLEEWSHRAHVFYLLAADVDRESLHGHLMARADGPGTRASERYVRNFQEIFRIQEDLLERAEAEEIPIVDVQDLESAVQTVVKHVVGELGVRREAEQASLD
jgi:2-phosphoglycerate kinase